MKREKENVEVGYDKLKSQQMESSRNQDSEELVSAREQVSSLKDELKAQQKYSDNLIHVS